MFSPTFFKNDKKNLYTKQFYIKVFQLNENESYYNKIFKLAENANCYANSQIFLISTHIKNNDFLLNGETKYFYALCDKVTNLRKRTKDLFEQAQENQSFISLDEDDVIKNYEIKITESAKSSLGNCAELTYQAFDFILNTNSDVNNAEIYEIIGKKNPMDGDHVFLVLNRDPNSDPSDPMTWGKNAIICDPWAKTVFPASEYLLKLKNYYYDKDSLTNKNCIEDFNPEKHILKPKPN
jgi:hypothetical protein